MSDDQLCFVMSYVGVYVNALCMYHDCMLLIIYVDAIYR
jgi:hypothetical protein